MRRSTFFAIMAVVSLWTSVGAQKPSARDDSVEDIYVVRSVRLSRMPATAFCAEKRVGFRTENDDQYSLRAVLTQSSDGRITNTNGPEAGRVHGCFGPTSDPMVLNFYAEGVLGKISFTGSGDCRIVRADLPESGITPVRCVLVLTDLPAGYVGGLLTSNSVTTRQPLGLTSDPPGYVQPSIATVRLWKKR